MEDYLTKETEYTTFIPVGSKAVGKKIKDIEDFGVKVAYYYNNPVTFDDHLNPKPNIELMTGMGISVVGQRIKIKNLRETLDLP